MIVIVHPLLQLNSCRSSNWCWCVNSWDENVIILFLNNIYRFWHLLFRVSAPETSWSTLETRLVRAQRPGAVHLQGERGRCGNRGAASARLEPGQGADYSGLGAWGRSQGGAGLQADPPRQWGRRVLCREHEYCCEVDRTAGRCSHLGVGLTPLLISEVFEICNTHEHSFCCQTKIHSISERIILIATIHLLMEWYRLHCNKVDPSLICMYNIVYWILCYHWWHW